MERSWLDLRHTPPDNAGLKTKDAAQAQAQHGACLKVSDKLRLHRLRIRAAVKRRDGAARDVNVHAPGAAPKAAALEEKITALCEEELLLQWRVQDAVLMLDMLQDGQLQR